MVRITPAAAEPGHERQRKRRRLEGRADELPKTSADFYVAQLPGAPQTRHAIYSGHLPATVRANPPSADDSDATLFFLLSRNRHIARKERLVIWLNGGPGCSSFDGAMIELGPLRVNDDGSLRAVDHAWNEYSNILFLDQPAGTGYSYVNQHDDVRELGPAADQVVTFLQNFYEVFPEFGSMDTFIAGESYAGQYIPYIADAILRQTNIPTRLKGLLIGNGWISPKHQYPAYLQYLLDENIIKPRSKAANSLHATVTKCQETLATMHERDPSGKGTVLVPECEEILGVMGSVTQKDGKCLNLYDTREYQTCGAEWPPAIIPLTKYLQRADVIQALHAEAASPQKWVHCSSTVGSHFWTPNSIPAVSLLPKILDKIPILLYAGDRDVMCAYTGIKSMIDDLEWRGATGFNGSEAMDWLVDGVQVGEWTTARNLTYVKVWQSSHMVPMDLPVVAHDMLVRFLGIDTLTAAGPSALIPSRVGQESDEILGATHPNGSTLQSSEDIESDSAYIPPVELDGFDKEHEAKFGPRRTVLLVLLLLAAGLGIWAFSRWIARRRMEKYRKFKGKGRASMGSTAFRMSGKSWKAAARERAERAAERERVKSEAWSPDLKRSEPGPWPETPQRGGSVAAVAAGAGAAGAAAGTIFDVGGEEEEADGDSDATDYEAYEDEPLANDEEEEDEDEEDMGDMGAADNPWQANS